MNLIHISIYRLKPSNGRKEKVTFQDFDGGKKGMCWKFGGCEY